MHHQTLVIIYEPSLSNSGANSEKHKMATGLLRSCDSMAIPKSYTGFFIDVF